MRCHDMVYTCKIVRSLLGQEKQAAAKHLDLALKTTPWTLTDNYVSREKENKGAQMAFAGPGDPTGKGRGFSFVKDTRKVSSLIRSSLLHHRSSTIKGRRTASTTDTDNNNVQLQRRRLFPHGCKACHPQPFCTVMGAMIHPYSPKFHLNIQQWRPRPLLSCTHTRHLYPEEEEEDDEEEEEEEEEVSSLNCCPKATDLGKAMPCCRCPVVSEHKCPALRCRAWATRQPSRRRAS